MEILEAESRELSKDLLKEIQPLPSPQSVSIGTIIHSLMLNAKIGWHALIDCGLLSGPF